jgi:hypothetical protein
MRAVVRLEAFKSLIATIEAAIPELRGHIELVQVPPEQHLTFPSLAIVAGSHFRYDQSQEDEARDDEGNAIQPDASSLVANLGAWETTVQFELACATLADRYAYEETLTELFNQRQGARGVLLTTVTSCPALGHILASWTLNDTGWKDDKAFSSQHWAVLEVDGTIPVLVTRRGTYTFEELRLGLTRDLSIPATPAGFSSVPVVEINADGTVTRIAP